MNYALLVGLLLFTGLSTQRKSPPPGTVVLSDRLYIDAAPICNYEWREAWFFVGGGCLCGQTSFWKWGNSSLYYIYNTVYLYSASNGPRHFFALLRLRPSYSMPVQRDPPKLLDHVDI